MKWPISVRQLRRNGLLPLEIPDENRPFRRIFCRPFREAWPPLTGDARRRIPSDSSNSVVSSSFLPSVRADRIVIPSAVVGLRAVFLRDMYVANSARKHIFRWKKRHFSSGKMPFFSSVHTKYVTNTHQALC